MIHHRHNLTAPCQTVPGNRRWSERSVQVRRRITELVPDLCFATVDVLSFVTIAIADRTGIPDAHVAEHVAELARGLASDYARAN